MVCSTKYELKHCLAASELLTYTVVRTGHPRGSQPNPSFPSQRGSASVPASSAGVELELGRNSAGQSVKRFLRPKKDDSIDVGEYTIRKRVASEDPIPFRAGIRSVTDTAGLLQLLLFTLSLIFFFQPSHLFKEAFPRHCLQNSRSFLSNECAQQTAYIHNICLVPCSLQGCCIESHIHVSRYPGIYYFSIKSFLFNE
jgi:hypothetical protein